MTADLFGPTFPTIVADPPWAERGGGKIKRGADRHYPLAGKLGDPGPIIAAMRSSPILRPAENAHAWIWATDNFLRDGLTVLDAIGFRYVRTFVWVKGPAEETDDVDDLDLGLGQYGRGSHELLLFGVRGKGQDPSVWTGARDVRSVFFSPRTVHSRKPDQSYELIQRVSRGPYAELFARRQYGPAWSVWGNEAPETTP